MNLLLLDSEHLRERPRVQLHSLAGVVDDEVVAVPGQRHRVRLDRVVVVARRAVGEVDRVGAAASAASASPIPNLERLTHETVGRARRAPWPPRNVTAGSRTRRSTSISDAAWSACSCVSASTIAIGWPFQWMLVVLHDGQVTAAGRLGGRQEERRWRHPRRVPVRHHQHDAWRGLGRARVERRDATASDRAVAQRRVDHALHRHLGGEARVAPDLERAVEPRDRRADQAVLVAQQRIGAGLQGPALRGGGERPVAVAQGSSACPPRSAAPRTAAIVRRASSTLNALSRSGRASASSASAAARKVSSVAGRPRSASSARQARQGLGATPPSASRTSAIASPSSSSAAATETSAKA